MSTRWITWTCTVRAADVAAVEALLEDAGAAAVTCTAANEAPLLVDELDGHSPLWPVCRVAGLFDGPTGLAVLERRFSAAGLAPIAVKVDELPDEQWQSVWRDHFEPRVFGDRLCVCPTWREPPPGALTVIRLDPGMAFGTGNHATTALCLEWIASSDAIRGRRVLDYGCGSGILALAAAAMGAARVDAFDIDEQALAVCRENALLNALPSVVTVEAADLIPGGYDLIVANILLEPLVALAARLHALLAPDGCIVLSGVLASQVPDLLAAYAGAFNMQLPLRRDEWALIAGTRVANPSEQPTR